MIEVNYNEYKETIAQNMKLIVENHDLKQEIERLKNRLEESQLAFLSVNKKNNKAIEYIKKINDEDIAYTIGWVKNDLIDILEGKE